MVAHRKGVVVEEGARTGRQQGQMGWERMNWSRACTELGVGGVGIRPHYGAALGPARWGASSPAPSSMDHEGKQGLGESFGAPARTMALIPSVQRPGASEGQLLPGLVRLDLGSPLLLAGQNQADPAACSSRFHLPLYVGGRSETACAIFNKHSRVVKEASPGVCAQQLSGE